MINLLPPEMKEEFTYARRNTKLLAWAGALLVTVIGVFIVVFAGQLYIDQSTKSYQAQIVQAEEQLKIQKLEETQKKVEDISSSLKLVVQVLSRQVMFSALLKQIGAAMPQNTVLTNLNINKIEGGIELSAAASSYQSATQIQLNLQDSSNKIFEKADIVNINCNSTTSNSGNQLDGVYPCKIVIKALFTKNNPFLFINATSQAKVQP
ncbi:MAG: hypothetical protein JWL85_474 [Candidatus Saccharibacteria bacterium]|nr:hypothetical protein [Candidatus Saccharibacteria bacterium]